MIRDDPHTYHISSLYLIKGPKPPFIHASPMQDATIKNLLQKSDAKEKEGFCQLDPPKIKDADSVFAP